MVSIFSRGRTSPQINPAVTSEANKLQPGEVVPMVADESPVTLSDTAETSVVDNIDTSVPKPSMTPAQAVSFEEIVSRYHGKVFQLVYRYTGDYEESCDLTQDTFVRAYAAWNEFRGDSQIYTWLYRIAINLCHNHQKKVQRRRLAERISLDAPIGDDNRDNQEGFQVADERPLPLQILESCELRVRLQEALLELPENYRTVIVLRDIEGLTYEEIARVTDSTLEAIKSRLFRARNAVRRLMEPYLQGPLPDAAGLEKSSQNKENTKAPSSVSGARAAATASPLKVPNRSSSSYTSRN
jgi:RNA polymerase sigma-70 factor (ECF subfamily)